MFSLIYFYFAFTPVNIGHRHIRVESRVSDDSFMISWFERKGKSKTFVRSNLAEDEIEDASGND